jgi:hypothetical protein
VGGEWGLFVALADDNLPKLDMQCLTKQLNKTQISKQKIINIAYVCNETYLKYIYNVHI